MHFIKVGLRSCGFASSLHLYSGVQMEFSIHYGIGNFEEFGVFRIV